MRLPAQQLRRESESCHDWASTDGRKATCEMAAVLTGGAISDWYCIVQYFSTFGANDRKSRQAQRTDTGDIGGNEDGAG